MSHAVKIQIYIEHQISGMKNGKNNNNESANLLTFGKSFSSQWVGGTAFLVNSNMRNA